MLNSWNNCRLVELRRGRFAFCRSYETAVRGRARGVQCNLESFIQPTVSTYIDHQLIDVNMFEPEYAELVELVQQSARFRANLSNQQERTVIKETVSANMSRNNQAGKLIITNISMAQMILWMR